jgi:hypothetical protein
MIKTLICALSAVLVAASSFAGGFHLDKVITDGTWYVTNSASASWDIKAITFKHSENCTNDFTVSRIRPYVIETKYTVVSTNAPLLVGFGLKDAVTTNTYVVKSIEYVTNVMFTASTTNVTTDLVYGEDNLNYGWRIHASDIVKFDMSFTNNSIYISVDVE